MHYNGTDHSIEVDVGDRHRVDDHPVEATDTLVLTDYGREVVARLGLGQPPAN